MSDRGAAVQELADQGLLAREIGARLGWTKNVVVGICHREGIQLKAPSSWAGTPQNGYGLAKGGGAHANPKLSKLATSPGQRRVARGVPLRERGCRWPAWGNEAPTHLFCGADKDLLKPYCDGHMAVAYQQTDRSKLVPAIR